MTQFLSQLQAHRGLVHSQSSIHRPCQDQISAMVMPLNLREVAGSPELAVQHKSLTSIRLGAINMTSRHLDVG